MRVLVTGATGFVGRYTVPAIARRGHTVRALVRDTPGRMDNPVRPQTSPQATDKDVHPTCATEFVHADLLQPSTLAPALHEVDTVVHLAISLTPNREVLLNETIEATTNLCKAMVAENVTRIVHCSSRAVYDWAGAQKTPNESAPLDPVPHLRDEYTQAKIAQEELIQKYAEKHNWTVTILRPGFIWGEGRQQLAGWGHSLGPLHLVVNSRRRLPMTYIENCADCIALAVDTPAAAGQIFNIVDDDLPTAREFAELCTRLAGQGGVFMNLPYAPGLLFAKLATGINRTLLGGRVNLPGLLKPPSYRARFHPLHLSNQKAKDVLGWRPRYNFQESWQRSLEAHGPQEATHGG